MFGPVVPTIGVAGVLKEVTPLNACAPVAPISPVNRGLNWVALIERSASSEDPDHNCTFVQKVMRAEEAGAVAAIVFDNADERLRRMIPDPWNPLLSPTIPSVFVTKSSGEQMRKIAALSSHPESDPIVVLVARPRLEWISVFTSTTVGLLAVGTVMVLFILARHQQIGLGRASAFGPDGDIEGGAGAGPHGPNGRRVKFATLSVAEIERLPIVEHHATCASAMGGGGCVCHASAMDACHAADESKNSSGKDGGSKEEEAGPSASSRGKDPCCDGGEAGGAAACGGTEMGGMGKMGSDKDVCAVCLEEYEEREKLRELPCSHRFHVACIDEWLMKMQPFCPLCKFDVGKFVRENSTDPATRACHVSHAGSAGSEGEEGDGRWEEAREGEVAPDPAEGSGSGGEGEDTPLLWRGEEAEPAPRWGIFRRLGWPLGGRRAGDEAPGDAPLTEPLATAEEV